MSHGYLRESLAKKEAAPPTSRASYAQPDQGGLHSPIFQLQQKLGNDRMGRLIQAVSHEVGSPRISGQPEQGGLHSGNSRDALKRRGVGSRSSITQEGGLKP